MNTQTKQWLKYLGLVQTYWENLKRWVLGPRYNPPSYLRYGNRLYWYDSEAFIQLYMQLSKGGCKDFTEEVCFVKEVEGLEYEYVYTAGYSKLHFKDPVLLGTVNYHRQENICEQL